MIEAKDLRKSYGGHEAVKGVSFAVRSCSVSGLLGPNGAGKTTIMRMLSGCIIPDSGSASIEGIDVATDSLAARKLTGYMPESAPIYPEMTVSEYLEFIADIRGLSGKLKAAAFERTVGACGLAPVFFRPLGELSRGYRQRVGLAQAIIHDPAVLILDEPTAGLDPNQVIEIRNLIKNLGREKTIILSTHILGEVEALCSDIIILNEGRAVAAGPVDVVGAALTSEIGIRLRLKSARAETGPEERRAALETIPGLARIVSAESAGDILEARIALEPKAGQDSSDPAESIADWAGAHDYKILGLEQSRLSLEQMFAALTGPAGGEEE